MYIIGMNGPPHSGKDSVANALAAIIEDAGGQQPLRMALSQPMRETVFSLAGLFYDDPTYERTKDEPQEIFHGRTIRQEMIELSERHVKPRLGQDFWARRADVSIKQWDDSCAIISDFGFEAEARFFNARYDAMNVLVVQLYREGCDWSKDSRGYVGEEYQFLHISNNGTIQEAAEKVYDFCIVELGWTF